MSDSISNEGETTCPKAAPADTTADPDSSYVKNLLDCEQQAIDQFDKAIMTLSGGAIAISFAFLKDIVRSGFISDFVPFWPGTMRFCL